jgi:acetyl esterase/lipase
MSSGLPVCAALVALVSLLGGIMLVAPLLNNHVLFQVLVRIGGLYMKFMPHENDAHLSDQARAFNVLARAMMPSKYQTLEETRKQSEDAIKQIAFPLQLPKYDTRTIRDLRNSIYARDMSCIHASNEIKTVLLYAHCGGFSTGHPSFGSMIYRQLAESMTNGKCLDFFGVNYALVPEYTIEDSLDDMNYAYEYLVEQGYKNIVMLGDSAGGSITLLTIQDRLTPEQRALLSSVVLISPWIDLTRSTESYAVLGDTDIIFNQGAAQVYEEALDQVHKDLESFSIYKRIQNGEVLNVPRVFLTYSNSERVRDECQELAKYLEKDEKNQVVVAEGLPHLYAMFVPFIPEAVETVKEISKFIQLNN